jgi:hypothetical protein
MRRSGSLFLAVLMIGFLLGNDRAEALPTEGASELQVAGGFFHTQDTDEGNLNADLSYGYYLTPGWQLGLRQALNYNFVDDGRDFWLATTAPFINYHLASQTSSFPTSALSLGWRGMTETRRESSDRKVGSNSLCITTSF